MDTLGADILRLWVAATDYSGELSISEEILKRVVESYRRIRNTLRFLLANLADFDALRDALPVDDWLEIDRYAWVMTGDLQQALVPSERGVKQPALPGHYGNYEFHLVAQKLQSFCSEDLGGFYLDILKDRLYTAPAASHARRSAQNALYHITQSLTRLMAPILSFTAQEVWELLNGGEASVFEQTWYEFGLPRDAEALRTRWQKLRTLRSDVQKQLEELRVSGKIGSSLAGEVEVFANGENREFLASFADDLDSYSSLRRRASRIRRLATPSRRHCPMSASGSRQALTRNASAAGTTAKTSGTMRSIRSFAGAACRTCMARAKPAGTRDGEVARAELWHRAARPAHQVRHSSELHGEQGRRSHLVLQPGAGPQPWRGVQLSVRRRRLAARAVHHHRARGLGLDHLSAAPVSGSRSCSAWR